MIDADEIPITLHQFAGRVVLLDISTGWCEPCRDLAQTAELFYREHRDDGLIIIHMLYADNERNDPDAAFLDSWRSTYGLSFPVTRQETSATRDGLLLAGTWEGALPFQGRSRSQHEDPLRRPRDHVRGGAPGRTAARHHSLTRPRSTASLLRSGELVEHLPQRRTPIGPRTPK